MPARSLKYKMLKAFEEERLMKLDSLIPLYRKQSENVYGDMTSWLPGTGPEKILYNFLLKIHINFEYQYHADDLPSTLRDESDWIPDFRLPVYNYIIEVYGDYWHSIPSVISHDNLKQAYWLHQGYTIYRDGQVLKSSNGMEVGKVFIWWEREIQSDLVHLFVRDCPELLLPQPKNNVVPEITFDIEAQRVKMRTQKAAMANSKKRPTILPRKSSIGRRFKIKTQIDTVEKSISLIEKDLRHKYKIKGLLK